MTSSIETHTGLHFDYEDPRPEQVCIEDIAHALSMIPRFAGHCNFFYSVAEHSMNVANLLPPELKLAGLLHDAHEAYLGDIPTPLKRMMPTLKNLAWDIDVVIANALRPSTPVSLFSSQFHCQVVKDADHTMLRYEAAVLKKSCGTGPHWGYDESLNPNGGWVIGIEPDRAKGLFLRKYEGLRNAA